MGRSSCGAEDANDNESYSIVLYYKYTHIEDVEEVRQWQQDIAERLGLKGRIRIATEGINGTAGGTTEAIHEYIRLMRNRTQFHDVDFKLSSSNIGPGKCHIIALLPDYIHVGDLAYNVFVYVQCV